MGRRQKHVGTPTVSRAVPTDSSAEFHAHFSSQYLGRWQQLFQALAGPVQHVALVNQFAEGHTCEEQGMESLDVPGGLACYRFPEAPSTYPPPPTDIPTGLKQHYWLDLASLLPPLLLGVQPRHVVLDMCAAPGGKSLVLAHCLLHPASRASALQQAAARYLQDRQRQQQAGAHPAQHHQRQEDKELPLEQQQQQQQQQHEGAADAPGSPGAIAGSGSAVAEPYAGTPGAPSKQHLQQADPSHTAAASSNQDPPLEAAAAESQDSGRESEEDAEGSTQQAGPSSSCASGRLVCNEVDPGRRSRLQSVLLQYLPATARRRVRVTGHDAVKHFSTFDGGLYDRVLLDAPCSSDRHVVAAALEGAGVIAGTSWSLARVQQLAKLQTQLLLAGLRCLKPGGRLVYSTCSCSTLQNDDVVRAAVLQHNQQQRGRAAEAQQKVPLGPDAAAGQQLAAGGVYVVPLGDVDMPRQLAELLEGTSLGMISLPDTAGHGPIYAAVLEKLAA